MPSLRRNVRAQNVFGKQYETAQGYKSLPSSLYMGLTWRPW